MGSCVSVGMCVCVCVFCDTLTRFYGKLNISSLGVKCFNRHEKCKQISALKANNAAELRIAELWLGDENYANYNK